MHIVNSQIMLQKYDMILMKYAQITCFLIQKN
jgi:hypothetical protein